MSRFLVRRVATAIVLLVVITGLTFFLMSLMPDPTRAILGPGATTADLTAKRHELGLNRPLFDQYGTWFSHAIHGDLGISWFSGYPVRTSITDRLPITLSLAVLATLVSAILGIGLGMAAAIRRGWLDKAVQAVGTLGFAVPGIWLGLLLVIGFALKLHWFPATGYVPFGQNPWQWLRSLVLPVTSIAVGSIAAVAAQTRNAVASVLAREYIRTLRGRGLPRWRLLLRHVLRNSMPAALTVVSLQFIGLLGGAIVVEQIFALQGIGGFATSGATQSDTPVVLGVVVVGVVMVLVVNLVIDLVVGWLDPRARAR